MTLHTPQTNALFEIFMAAATLNDRLRLVDKTVDVECTVQKLTEVVEALKRDHDISKTGANKRPEFDCPHCSVGM